LRTLKIWPAPKEPLVRPETASLGVGVAVGVAPEQVGIKDTMGRGMSEGMMPEGRQDGMPEGRADRTLVGRATAVDARRAAEKAKDFILTIKE
jgi:hypothetical protein